MTTAWREIYSLNHEVIDMQHKELFRLADVVYNLDANTTTKALIGGLFKDFFCYMDEHFSVEEAYMKSIDYPFLFEHAQLHQNIIKAMTKVLKENKTISTLQQSIKRISQQWLVEHILINDLEIEKWRKSITVNVSDMLVIENLS